jgi:hypothetical protein
VAVGKCCSILVLWTARFSNSSLVTKNYRLISADPNFASESDIDNPHDRRHLKTMIRLDQ